MLFVIILINILFYNYFLKKINKNIKINSKYRYFTIILSYIILGIGFKMFVLPFCNNLSNQKCLLYSSLYGLIVYGIYNIINLFYIKNYKLKLALYDIIFNMCLGVFTTFIIKYFL